MQIFSSLVAPCMASAAFAAPSLLTINTEPVPDSSTEFTCAPNLQTGKFLRVFNPTTIDHFYTMDAQEMKNAVNELGYEQEATPGRLLYTQTQSTVPLYRAYNPVVMDHFYTTNEAEMIRAVSQLGYHAEGIAGFIYPNRACGAIPLYRAFRKAGFDHFYTTNEAEWRRAINSLGYVGEGITGYILPVSH